MKKIIRRCVFEWQLAKAVGIRKLFKLKTAATGELVEIEIKNIKVSVRANTPDLAVAISNIDGEFESLRSLFKPDYDGIIVDAGGYIGTASIALSNLYPNADVICIEASSNNMQVLSRNIKHFAKITAVQKALVASQNQKTIELRDRTTGAWGYTTINAPDDNDNADILETVECVTLQTLDIDVDRIGIVKLDIEGAEKDLFEKDASTYQNVPVLFVEIHDRILDGCYDAYKLFAKDRWTIRDGDGEKYLSLER